MTRDTMKDPFTILQDCHVHSTFSDGSGTVASNVLACTRAGCITIAFTDHVDERGAFTFLPSFRVQHSMQDYLEEIQQARHVAHDLKIIAGLEYMGGNTNKIGNFLSTIEPYAKFIELLLVDGSLSNNPEAIAMQLHDKTRKKPFNTIQVGIAHPDFEKVLQGDYEGLITRGILLELNESKFRRVDGNFVLQLIECARKDKIQNPNFITGSDAHSSSEVGKFPIISAYIASNSLQEYIRYF